MILRGSDLTPFICFSDSGCWQQWCLQNFRIFYIRSSMKSNHTYKANSHNTKDARAPNDAQFAHLWHNRTETDPLKVCPVPGVDPQTFPVRGVFTLLNFVQSVGLNSGNSLVVLCVLVAIDYSQEPNMHKFISVGHSVAVTFIAVPCWQLSYIPCIFRHCDLLVLKINRIHISNVMKRHWRLKRILEQTVKVKAGYGS